VLHTSYGKFGSTCHVGAMARARARGSSCRVGNLAFTMAGNTLIEQKISALPRKADMPTGMLAALRSVAGS
jgi:hypothetical protein